LDQLLRSHFDPRQQNLRAAQRLQLLAPKVHDEKRPEDTRDGACEELIQTRGRSIPVWVDQSARRSRVPCIC
jgi:hypothetical protein